MTPTFEQITEFLNYNMNSGVITWIKPSSTKTACGDVAGCMDGKGYLAIKIFNRIYRAHRLAWFLHFGEFPDGDIDHINGIRTDNRISNLRKATRSENLQNLKTPSTNKSGFIGVSFCKTRNKWRASIRPCVGQQKSLGYFLTKEDASKAYLEAKQKYHSFNPVPRCADCHMEKSAAKSADAKNPASSVR